jgi:hypothetical protein
MQQHNNYVEATQNVLCTDVLGSLWLACTFSCPLRLSEGNTERDDGSSKVFEAADLLVSPRLLLQVGQ